MGRFISNATDKRNAGPLKVMAMQELRLPGVLDPNVCQETGFSKVPDLVFAVEQ